MKRKLLLLPMLVGVTMFGNAQDYCRITNDTIIEGSDSSANSIYTYNNEYKLILVEQQDSASMSAVDRFDTVYYDNNGRILKTESYWFGNSTPYETALLVYDGNGRISRLEESGDNGSGAWTKAYNLSYNGSGELTSMIIDPSSITGQPEGMIANWENITWTNGNMSSVNLVADFGGGPVTIELSAFYDTKKNISRLEPITEGPDLVLSFCENNLSLIKLTNDEPGMGSAGDTAMYRVFTYNSYDEVETMTEYPYLFSERYEKKQYSYMCNTALGIVEQGNKSLIYPNPVVSELNFEAGLNVRSINIYDLQGRFVDQFTVANSGSVNLSKLDRGIYICEMIGDDIHQKVKIIKE